jgi:hypothetical protein
MSNYAVVKDGVVENMVVWDGVTNFSVPDSELIEATDDARIGGSWDGNVFTFVEPDPAPDTRTYDEKRSEAYDAAGCTISALAIATFESVFADDSSAAVRLQIQREKIREAIPKP